MSEEWTAGAVDTQLFLPETAQETHCYFEGVSKAMVEEANNRAQDVPFSAVFEVVEMTLWKRCKGRCGGAHAGMGAPACGL